MCIFGGILNFRSLCFIAFAAKKNESRMAFIFSRPLARVAGEPRGLKGDKFAG
jgi:hypothetical protein